MREYISTYVPGMMPWSTSSPRARRSESLLSRAANTTKHHGQNPERYYEARSFNTHAKYVCTSEVNPPSLFVMISSCDKPEEISQNRDASTSCGLWLPQDIFVGKVPSPAKKTNLSRFLGTHFLSKSFQLLAGHGEDFKYPDGVMCDVITEFGSGVNAPKSLRFNWLAMLTQWVGGHERFLNRKYDLRKVFFK